MDFETRKGAALKLWQQAVDAQMRGNLDEAVRLYQASLACCPTAEAHTFLGWAYSFLGRLDDAIAECRRAIAVDPEYGNPYNDIGSYLITSGKLDEAIPWLERAIAAPRYEPRHYPHCNLARVYRAKGMLRKAIDELDAALAIQPAYAYARRELAAIRAQLN
jgi:Tfp pilus assembly protein PilF